jgi:hypothetical protein
MSKHHGRLIMRSFHYRVHSEILANVKMSWMGMVDGWMKEGVEIYEWLS